MEWLRTTALVKQDITAQTAKTVSVILFQFCYFVGYFIPISGFFFLLVVKILRGKYQTTLSAKTAGIRLFKL